MTPADFTRRLERLERDLVPALRRVLGAAALAGERDAKRNATTAPHARTGRLRNSITSAVEASGDRLTLLLRSGLGAKDVRYARLQEEGGTVRPIRGKYLAIPVGPAKTSAGVARFASPRDVPVELRFVQSLRGQPLLVEQRGKGAKARVIVWYVLRRSVTVPARPYLRPAAEAVARALPGQIEAAITRLVGA